MYAMQRPVRVVAVSSLPDDAPFEVRVAVHSQLALIVSPGVSGAPEAEQVPVTGHNLLFTLTMPGGPHGRDVVVRSLHGQVTGERALHADGRSIAYDRMPALVLSSDLAESTLRAVAAYRPLQHPDLEIRLDQSPAALRPAGSRVPVFPLTVPAGGSAEVVCAPVTRSLHRVHWRLTAEIAYGNEVVRPYWDLVVTASTGMSSFHPDGTRTPLPVHQLYADHWNPDAPADPGARGVVPTRAFTLIAHAGREGIVRGTQRPDEPEPPQAAKRRAHADRLLAQGTYEAAAEAYRAAAEEGSARAAFTLGELLHYLDDLDGAVHWYTRAAQQRVAAAYSRLGVIARRSGDSDRAESWFRQAMGAGDWAGAVGLGGVMYQRGDLAQAEILWRMADANEVPNAGHNLAFLLESQGRHDEAEILFARLAENGEASAAEHLGFLKYGSEDMVEAERWWRTAADNGSARGAHCLGLLLYEEGRSEEAEHWWTLAARAGHPESPPRLAELALHDREDRAGFVHWARVAVEHEATRPEDLKAVAEALHGLTHHVITAPGVPPLAFAVETCTLAADAYRRLHSADASHREAYADTLRLLEFVGLAAGDGEAAASARSRLHHLEAQP
ncbi:tetratricopeptide repeat protein [Streptomyces sp. NPDC090445]|uniref:tetratricopeptide repeat protein n=1 Tax=Streptomyces sp. NPDC090445 TaxID=3365963 RepID=UPI00381CA8DA